ncbi:MAG TPA: glycosyltransferase family 2 protein [Clostridia bacterium]|nr:glycosyltransferase family 2 protein [Clostridia bacterium]
MEYDSGISLIIPCKPDGGNRDKNFSWLERRYTRLMPDAEICIEFDNSEPYCKSKSINTAASRAQNDIFVIADADIVFDPLQIYRAVKLLTQYTWVLPYVNRIELSEKDTMGLIEKCPCVNLADLSFLDYKVTQPGVGSICIVPRNSFNLVKGFDERFKGWGGEDCAFEMSLDTLCGLRYTPPDSTILHLYHPQSTTDTSQSPDFPANQVLYERYLGANGNPDLMKALIDEK